MGEGTLVKVEDGSVNWDHCEIPSQLIELVSFDSVKRYRFVPFEQGADHISVAVVDESDIDTQNALRFFAKKVSKDVRLYPIPEPDFQSLIKKYKDPEHEIGKALDDLERASQEEQVKQEKIKGIRQREDTVAVLQEAPVAKMVEVILKNAIDGGASDVHIEPGEDNVRVRYRVDGVLYNSIMLPGKVGPAIVSRIKILSNLKIDEKRKPQDGRFRMSDLGKHIDFRVSTFPIAHGEKVVMRILDTSTGLIELGSLGFWGRDVDVIQRLIQEPFGIILSTGPTGSGKSTTLYAILHALNKEGVNIVTLEDPVEYVVDGISQSQVRPEIGYTFASGLRSILRQDPDIVMVGEIRDTETAELAIHAALTGHLVLSTLHTNSSIGAIPRLVDMGMQPFLLSSAMKLVIGQRLVRRICPDCKTERESIPADIEQMIHKELQKISPDALAAYHISPDGPYTLYYGKGCNRCHQQGMKGRLVISEVLEVSDKLKRLITSEMHEAEIEAAARSEGFTSMKQDGILKALSGMTTIEEITRVTEDTGDEAVEAKGE